MDKQVNARKKKILFVCLGNICRSPAAEEIMRQIIENDVALMGNYDVDSAGIGSWHEGQLPDRRMREHGKKHGYDFHSIARQVHSSDFDDFDLILGMDEGNMSDLLSLTRNDSDREKLGCLADYMTAHPRYHTIPDPYYGGPSDFELAIELIEDGCRGLAEELKKK
jgi:protein-tyrosine phosphatase